MAKDPAFLFYPNDYIGGTMGMTFEEKGAYIELLMLQFNRGHMTSHMIGQTVGQIWDNIKSKFEQDDDGLYYNVRLDKEIKLRKEYTASRRNNISGVNQYTNNKRSYDHDMTTHMAGQTTSHMEDVNINEDNNINDTDNNVDAENKPSLDNTRFETFWKEYPKKTGKKKAQESWKRIKVTEELYQKILSAIEQAKISDQWKKDNGQFIPFPATWLNQGRWDDEYGGTKEPAQKLSGKYGTYL